MFYGWSDEISGDRKNVVRVNLNDDQFKWENVTVDNGDNFELLARDSFASCFYEDIFYMFAGYTDTDGSLMNSLVRFKLSNSSLTYDFISLENVSPEPRLSHSFVPISGELYLFGGKNLEKLYNDL